MVRFVFVLYCAALAVAPAARGQPSPGPAVPPRATVAFMRDINQLRWTSTLDLARAFGPWQVEVGNRFLSEAFLLREQLSDFRDENVADWSLGRPIGPRLTGRLHGRAAWYSLSDVFASDLLAGLGIDAGDGVRVEPAAGMAWDRRPGIAPPGGEPPLRLDAGPAFGLMLDAAPAPIDEYRLTIQARGRWHFISPRRGRTLHAVGRVARTFNRTRVAVEAGYAQLRRDTYQAASFLNRTEPVERLPETIEATRSDTLLAGLRIERPFETRWIFRTRVDLSTNTRAIRTLRASGDALFFDTDFTRREVDAEAALAYDRPALAGQLAVQTGATVERRRLANRIDLPPAQAALKGDLLRQADFDRGAFGLVGRLRTDPLPRVTVRLVGSSSILRRDTPEANFDDRDEVFHNGEVGLLFRPSRYVEADLNLFGTFLHTVYLNAERSAENNKQRSLRLRPSVRWRPARRTLVRLTAEVRATYTVDDFEIEGRPRSDQSARERRYEGEIDHRVRDGLRIRFEGRLSDLHLGRLLWDQFAEIPFDTLRTTSAWLRVQVGQPWSAELGMRAFVRRDFNRAATVRYPRVDDAGDPVREPDGSVVLNTITRPGREWIEQFGPTAAVEWPMRDGSAIRLDGWIQVQRIRQRLFGALPPDDADRIRTAARRGARRFIPNLSMSVLWRM